jgi:hypothetical protein
MNELNCIRQELAKYDPDQVVWDIEDLSKQPPWGNRISEDITNLSNYFVTSDGEDFLAVFERALQMGLEVGKPVKIESL